MKQINPEFIVLARESRGKTQKDFAVDLELEQGTLSKIENGLIPPSAVIMERICSLTKFPLSFFQQTVSPERVKGHYRKQLSLPAREEKLNSAWMTVMEATILKLLESVNIPVPNIPSWDVTTHGSPTLAAEYVRNSWHVTKGRILNVSRVFEDNGILVIPIDFAGSMDGLATFFDRRYPVIFLNKNTPGDRQRFTLAHELGHLVMHFGNKVIAPDRDIEKEAHEFAGEFLLPSRDMGFMLDNITLPKLAELKLFWHVSMQFLLRRAFDLGKVTKDQYYYMNRLMSAKGLRKNEGVYVPSEAPKLIKEMIDLFEQELNYTHNDFAAMFHLTPETFNEVYLQTRPKLRILKSPPKNDAIN